MTLADLVLLVIVGFVVGSLGRLAVPGPDPMPVWLTILIGLIGSVVGGSIAVALGLGGGWIFTVSVLVATVLVIAYRRFVQKRGITGPDAKRMPTRGKFEKEG